MRRSIPQPRFVVPFAAILLMATVGQTQAQDEFEIPPGDECVTCHLDLDEMPDGFQPYDVHFKHGLSCVGCHGGDATSDDEEIAMDEAVGFVGVPSPEQIPAFCGKCHSDLDYMRSF